jgi:hypothetical protein
MGPKVTSTSNNSLLSALKRKLVASKIPKSSKIDTEVVDIPVRAGILVVAFEVVIIF